MKASIVVLLVCLLVFVKCRHTRYRSHYSYYPQRSYRDEPREEEEEENGAEVLDSYEEAGSPAIFAEAFEHDHHHRRPVVRNYRAIDEDSTTEEPIFFSIDSIVDPNKPKPEKKNQKTETKKEKKKKSRNSTNSDVNVIEKIFKVMEAILSLAKAFLTGQVNQEKLVLI